MNNLNLFTLRRRPELEAADNRRDDRFLLQQREALPDAIARTGSERNEREPMMSIDILRQKSIGIKAFRVLKVSAEAVADAEAEKGKWMRRITSHVSAFFGSIVLKLPFISVNKINLKCDERVFRYPVSAWRESARVSRDCRTAGLLLRVFLAGFAKNFNHESKSHSPITRSSLILRLMFGTEG